MISFHIHIPARFNTKSIYKCKKEDILLVNIQLYLSVSILKQPYNLHIILYNESYTLSWRGKKGWKICLYV